MNKKNQKNQLMYLLAVALAGCGKRKKQEVQVQSDDVKDVQSDDNSYEESNMVSDSDVSEEVEVEEDKSERLVKVHFGFDQAEPTAEDLNLLKSSWANPSEEDKNAKIVISGNCDKRGSASYNLGLGSRRAEAIKRLLVSLGYNVKNIETRSLGQTVLVEGDSESAYAENRVALISINGKNVVSESSSKNKKMIENSAPSSKTDEEDEEDEEDED